MTRIANGESLPAEFVANDHTYNYDYYNIDDIYPRWQTSVKSVEKPKGKEMLHFDNAQAAARKDVKRVFGILQAQFSILSGPARFYDQEILWYIMNTCVSMHNMIIKDECGQDLDYSKYDLMGCHVRVHRREERVACFIA